jgi:3-oxoacyl-(acyl-carrier-protein) synthase
MMVSSITVLQRPVHKIQALKSRLMPNVSALLPARVWRYYRLKSAMQPMTKAARAVFRHFRPGNIINMISGNFDRIRIAPNYAIVTACSTGTHNIDAARMIKYGDADDDCYGAERCTTSPTAMGGFASAKALSTAITIRRPQAVLGIGS